MFLKKTIKKTNKKQSQWSVSQGNDYAETKTLTCFFFLFVFFCSYSFCRRSQSISSNRWESATGGKGAVSVESLRTEASSGHNESR